MKLTSCEHDEFLRACVDPRITENERRLLCYCAGMYDCDEPVSKAKYLRACTILAHARDQPIERAPRMVVQSIAGSDVDPTHQVRQPARVLACMNYAAGYMRGLRRAFHGETFCKPGDHARWMQLEDEFGAGYRDGFASTMPRRIL